MELLSPPFHKFIGFLKEISYITPLFKHENLSCSVKLHLLPTANLPELDLSSTFPWLTRYLCTPIFAAATRQFWLKVTFLPCSVKVNPSRQAYALAHCAIEKCVSWLKIHIPLPNALVWNRIHGNALKFDAFESDLVIIQFQRVACHQLHNAIRCASPTPVNEENSQFAHRVIAYRTTHLQ